MPSGANCGCRIAIPNQTRRSLTYCGRKMVLTLGAASSIAFAYQNSLAFIPDWSDRCRDAVITTKGAEILPLSIKPCPDTPVR
jgi:hypothetical protein